MANKDIYILQEQLNGSLKETLLDAALIGAQGTPIVSDTAPDISTLKDGQIWVRKSDLQQFFLYNDGDSRAWAQLPPPPHTHSEIDVTNLQTLLDGKSDKGHSHTAADITDFASAVGALTVGTQYSSTVPDTTVSVSVGGATPEAASVWKTRTLSQALDTILFPTILPSVKTAKSTSLSVTGSSGVLEVGTSYSRTLTATFSRGEIRNGDGTTNPNPLVGAVDTSTGKGYTFSGPGVTGAATQSGNTYSFTTSVISGSNSWSVIVDHTTGTGDYYNNKGAVTTNLDNSRVSGTSSANSSPSVTGIYPYYYIKSPVDFTAQQFKDAIADGNATNIHASATLTKVVASSTGTLSIPYNVNSQVFGVAYPSSSTEKTYYLTGSIDQGPITAVFRDKVELSTSGTSGTWTGQLYKYHITKLPQTNSAATIEIRNS